MPSSGHGRETAHLIARHPADRKDDADPIAAGLFLRVHADVGGAIDGGAWQQRLGRNAIELVAELLLDQFQHRLDAQPVEDVFEPGPGPVGAVAVIDEHPHDGIRHLVASGGPAPARPCRGRKSLWPVMPPIVRRNRTPAVDAEAVIHRHRLEADVVGVFQHRDDAAAVESDVELPRQAVHLALVEDVKVHSRA